MGEFFGSLRAIFSCRVRKTVFALFEHGTSTDSRWRSVITVKQILIGIQDLLDQPNPSDPAQIDAYQFFIQDSPEYKRRVRQSANEIEAEIQASVLQWLTDAANVRQQQTQSMQSVRSSKSLVETGCSEAEQCSMIKSMPRVFSFV